MIPLALPPCSPFVLPPFAVKCFTLSRMFLLLQTFHRHKIPASIKIISGFPEPRDESSSIVFARCQIELRF